MIWLLGKRQLLPHLCARTALLPARHIAEKKTIQRSGPACVTGKLAGQAVS